jgi:hypothetical protein
VAPSGSSGTKSAAAIFDNTPGSQVVDMLTYRPGQDGLIYDTNAKGMRAVNMWQPSSLVPAQNVIDADVQIWRDHVELIFGPLDGPAARHFLDCAAFRLQHRGVKINHALLVWGPIHGTGKDSVFVPIFRAIGEHTTRSPYWRIG